MCILAFNQMLISPQTIDADSVGASGLAALTKITEQPRRLPSSHKLLSAVSLVSDSPALSKRVTCSRKYVFKTTSYPREVVVDIRYRLALRQLMNNIPEARR